MPGRKVQRTLPVQPCPICSAPFQPYRDSQIACSRSCRDKAIRRGVVNPKATERDLVCRRCAAQFVAVWTGLGAQPSCPDCTAAQARSNQDRKNAARRIAVNPERREVNRRELLRRRYGLTMQEYEQMLTQQKGLCAICGDPPDPNGVRASSRLHVDHDHLTGANRELLCTRCNRGVGYFRDNPKLLQAAAEYIERHRSAD